MAARQDLVILGTRTLFPLFPARVISWASRVLLERWRFRLGTFRAVRCRVRPFGSTSHSLVWGLTPESTSGPGMLAATLTASRSRLGCQSPRLGVRYWSDSWA